MKNTTIFQVICLSICCLCPHNAYSEADKKPAKQASNTTVEIPPSRNQVIKFTDKGIVPSELHMKKEDSIVFFLNDTSSSLTSMVVEFGEKSTHCGGAKMQTGDHGRISTTRPFGPNDFASTCFHEAGVYPFKVYGLKANPKGIESKIYVE